MSSRHVDFIWVNCVKSRNVRYLCREMASLYFSRGCVMSCAILLPTFVHLRREHLLGPVRPHKL